MIYTITLNPAVDIFLETDQFRPKMTNYYHHSYQSLGGKGINVAIILNNFATPVLTTGFLGLKNKALFLKTFQKINLKSSFIFYQGKTRLNFKLKDATELNGVNRIKNQQVVQELLSSLNSLVQENDLVVASGSLPLGVADDIYYQIGEIVQLKKAYFFLDTTKEPLKKALKIQPYLIKPNLQEISELLNEPFTTDFQIIFNWVKTLQKLGAQNVLLSMGSQGSYFFNQDLSLIYQIGVPQGQLVNSVGAGDSMLAGFVYGFEKNFDLETTLKYAAAAGSATAFQQGLAKKDDIEKYFQQIPLQKIVKK